jgi:hypothetical protein
MGRDNPFRDPNRPIPSANVVLLNQPKDPMEPLGKLISEVVDEALRQENNNIPTRDAFITGMAAQLRFILMVDKQMQEPDNGE